MFGVRLTFANVVAFLALVLAVCGGAVAIGQTGSGTTLAACYKTKGKAKGAMRYLTNASARCKRRERKIVWNRSGPQGAPGPAGAAGPQGVAGPRGPAGPSGAGGGAAPSGTVGFFDLDACPDGWTPYAAGAGRYVVGLPPSGVRGAAVGAALGAQENRAVGRHAHTVNDPGHVHSVTFDNDMYAVPDQNTLAGTNRVGLDGGAHASQSATTGITIAAAGATAGTIAPYVQLLACRTA